MASLSSSCSSPSSWFTTAAAAGGGETVTKTYRIGPFTLGPGETVVVFNGLEQTIADPVGTAVAKLTDRQYEVLRQIAAGLSNAGIAARLVLSERTVDAHLRNIFRKLGITSRRQLRALPLP